MQTPIQALETLFSDIQSIIQYDLEQISRTNSTNKTLEKFIQIGQTFSKSLASMTTSEILSNIPYLNATSQLSPLNNKLVRLTCMVKDCLPSGAFSLGCRDAQTNKVYINPLKSNPVPTEIFNESKDPWARFLPIQEIMMTIDRHLACSPPSLSKWAMNLFAGIIKPQDNQQAVQNRKFCLLHCQQFFKKEDNIQFPINQVFQVYGILQIRSQGQSQISMPQQDKLQELNEQKYSIMVLKVNGHDSQLSKQLMKQAYLSLASQQNIGYLDSNEFYPTSANKLKNIFTQLLGGDNLAAEYILFNLVSNYYKKVENILFDNIPINIIGTHLLTLHECQDNKITTAEILIRFISLIKEYCMPIPLSIDFLNKHPAVPVKNLETDKLEEGFLQQSNGSQLIINQTQMTEGKINEEGMKSIYALRDAYTSQVVMYDFKYSQIEFKTNFNYLILSEMKSLINKDELKQIYPGESTECSSNLQALQQLTQEDFWSFRNYFREMRLNASGIVLSQQIANFASEYYVKMRKEAKNNEGQFSIEQMNPVFLSNWLTLTRLKVKSEGRKDVLKQDLEYVLNMEKELAQREKVYLKNKPKN